MEETILLYHMDENIKNIIQTLSQHLGVIVKDIDDSLKCQSMGYILGIDGFEKSDELELTDDMEKEFVFFAGMVEEQLDILLDLFKMAGIPMIPYKAMLTEHNVEYPFYQLYRNVAHEYAQIAGIKD